MKNAKSIRQIAALAKKCGITEREANAAINNLVRGDGGVIPPAGLE